MKTKTEINKKEPFLCTDKDGNECNCIEITCHNCETVSNLQVDITKRQYVYFYTCANCGNSFRGSYTTKPKNQDSEQ
jgi:transcription elongation factor Elf1